MAKATTQNKATKVETKSEPVVESKPVETKKGVTKKTKEEVPEKETKKVASKKLKEEVVPEKEPEPEPVPVPVPVKETKKTSSKKTKKPEPVQENDEGEPEDEPEVKPEPVKETKKTSSKKTKKPEPVQENDEGEPEDEPEVKPEPVKETKKTSSKKTKKPEPVQENDEGEPEDEPEGEPVGEPVKSSHRFFRCVFKNTDGDIVHVGRYSGKKPKQAARKALTGIVKKNELGVGERVIFLIQECTRGSKKKKYSYVGAQVNLPNPITVTIRKKDGQQSEIVYTKDNEVKKISLSECGDLLDVVMEEDGPEVAPVRLKRKPVKKATKKATKKVTVAKEVKEDEVPVKEEPKKVKSTKAKSK
jgi:hypothetical protein